MRYFKYGNLLFLIFLSTCSGAFDHPSFRTIPDQFTMSISGKTYSIKLTLTTNSNTATEPHIGTYVPQESISISFQEINEESQPTALSIGTAQMSHHFFSALATLSFPEQSAMEEQKSRMYSLLSVVALAFYKHRNFPSIETLSDAQLNPNTNLVELYCRRGQKAIVRLHFDTCLTESFHGRFESILNKNDPVFFSFSNLVTNPLISVPANCLSWLHSSLTRLQITSATRGKEDVTLSQQGTSILVTPPSGSVANSFTLPWPLLSQLMRLSPNVSTSILVRAVLLLGLYPQRLYPDLSLGVTLAISDSGNELTVTGTNNTSHQQTCVTLTLSSTAQNLSVSITSAFGGGTQVYTVSPLPPPPYPEEAFEVQGQEIVGSANPSLMQEFVEGAIAAGQVLAPPPHQNNDQEFITLNTLIPMVSTLRNP